MKQLNVKVEDGVILTDKKEVCQGWKEYFEGFINVGDRSSTQIAVTLGTRVSVCEKEDQNIIRDELVEALMKLKA